MDSREQRDHRHAVKLAAREHHARLLTDFEKAQDHHDAARELASEAKDRAPKFTDKEKIKLEEIIQSDLMMRLEGRDTYSWRIAAITLKHAML